MKHFRWELPNEMISIEKVFALFKQCSVFSIAGFCLMCSEKKNEEEHPLLKILLYNFFAAFLSFAQRYENKFFLFFHLIIL